MLGLSNGLWPRQGSERIWDLTLAEAPDLVFGRESAATAPAPSGGLVVFARDAPRRTGRGLLLEAAATNKLAVRNATPEDLSGLIKGGDAAATLTLVDDMPALAAAGLTTVCTTGRVFRLDNSLGTGSATVLVEGAVGTLTAHSVSLWARAVRAAGAENIRPGLYASPNSTVTSTAFSGLAAYRRLVVENVMPTSGTNRLGVRAEPGATVWFILPQLETGAQASSLIVTEGAPASRAAEAASLPTPPGASRFTAVHGDAGLSVSGPVSGAAFDLVEGRPWIGLGKELKRLEMR